MSTRPPAQDQYNFVRTSKFFRFEQFQNLIWENYRNRGQIDNPNTCDHSLSWLSTDMVMTNNKCVGYFPLCNKMFLFSGILIIL
jgi:hypothetical protein